MGILAYLFVETMFLRLKPVIPPCAPDDPLCRRSADSHVWFWWGKQPEVVREQILKSIQTVNITYLTHKVNIMGGGGEWHDNNRKTTLCLDCYIFFKGYFWKHFSFVSVQSDRNIWREKGWHVTKITCKIRTHMVTGAKLCALACGAMRMPHVLFETGLSINLNSTPKPNNFKRKNTLMLKCNLHVSCLQP